MHDASAVLQSLIAHTHNAHRYMLAAHTHSRHGFRQAIAAAPHNRCTVHADSRTPGPTWCIYVRCHIFVQAHLNTSIESAVLAALRSAYLCVHLLLCARTILAMPELCMLTSCSCPAWARLMMPSARHAASARRAMAACTLLCAIRFNMAASDCWAVGRHACALRRTRCPAMLWAASVMWTQAPWATSGS